MKKLFIALVVVLGWTYPAFATVIYDFDSLTSGTTTSFVYPGSVTATFSSPDGSAFFVAPSFFSSLSGQVLLDSDPPLHALDIAFSAPVSAIHLIFALNASGAPTLLPTSLSLEAFSGGIGGTSIGSASATGVVPPGFTYPEGTLAFSGGVFDAVRISSGAADFAVDDITIDQVPEPGTLLLLGSGISALVLRRRRKA